MRTMKVLGSILAAATVVSGCGPVRHGLIPDARREFAMTPEDNRACRWALDGLSSHEGEHASDSTIAESRESLRSCVQGNMRELAPEVWLGAVEANLCALERLSARIKLDIEREKAKSALVGAVAPPKMYDLGEDAMQVVERVERQKLVLTRFESNPSNHALLGRARQIHSAPDCSGPSMVGADCIRCSSEVPAGRLTCHAVEACNVSEETRHAITHVAY